MWVKSINGSYLSLPDMEEFLMKLPGEEIALKLTMANPFGKALDTIWSPVIES